MADFAWETFTPNMRATLMFVVRGEEVLLIRKKRGLGAGKMNGPGGKIELGETPLQAVLRETQEEVGVLPDQVTELGLLRFQFTDGLAIVCHVFRAEGFTGNLIETDEATPFWVAWDAVPYREMWTDDRYWLPHVRQGTRFHADFAFDGETMLSHAVTPELAVLPPL